MQTNEILKAWELDQQIREFGSWYALTESSYTELYGKWKANLHFHFDRYTLVSNERICFVGTYTNKSTEEIKGMRFFVNIYEMLTILKISLDEFACLLEIFETTNRFAKEHAFMRVRTQGKLPRKAECSTELAKDKTGIQTSLGVIVPFWYIVKCMSPDDYLVDHLL